MQQICLIFCQCAKSASFFHKNSKFTFLATFLDYWVTSNVHTSSFFIGKPTFDFLLVIIELFTLNSYGYVVRIATNFNKKWGHTTSADTLPKMGYIDPWNLWLHDPCSTWINVYEQFTDHTTLMSERLIMNQMTFIMQVTTLKHTHTAWAHTEHSATPLQLANPLRFCNIC